MSGVVGVGRRRGLLAEVWDYYFDPAGLVSAGSTGSGASEASDGYPEVGGSLRWCSIPAGRGEVTERVLEHESRRLHRVAFSDPETTGELRTQLRDRGIRGRWLTQELEYRLLSRGPFAWLTDRLFIRSQMRGSMRRSLDRLRLEVEEAGGRLD